MINLALKTHYSLESLLKPNQVHGTHMGIADYKSMGGIVQFYKACKSKGVVPIIGYSSEEIFLAANQTQYKELLHGFSECRIPKTLCIVGSPFLGLWNLIQKNSVPTFVENAYEVAKDYILDIKTKVDRVFLAQVDRPEPCYVAQNELLHDLAKELDLPLVPVLERFYDKPEDAQDHKIYIANKTKIKPREFELMEDRYKRFYYGDYSQVEYKPYDIDKLLGLIEPYEILSPPKLPKFSDNDDELFKEKLRAGWKRLGLKEQSYVDQVKHEIKILTECGLSSYFLILEDFMTWCRNQGWLVGYGRGSAAGCISSWLLGITRVDPIQYGLFFERFWSENRKGSLPDIDVDIPKFKRAEALNYLRNKYGHASVCQMVTYSVLQGRSALKTVLRFNETCSPDEMNEITNNIPELAKVEDQMIAVGEESLIRWTLEYMPERLNQYARLENGVVVGDLAKEFEQAIRLEGAIIGTGKHASAVIVYDGIVKDVCPMMPDKSSDELMAGVAMGDADSLALVKFDLLGLATLDKLMMVKQLLEEKHGH